jgi:AcrR family transcriptional regulator
VNLPGRDPTVERGEAVTAEESAPVRRRENTRARLLEAAAEVFAEAGLGEASVERICERAGFTRGAFYSNFSSKDEMFLELCKVVARDHVAAVRMRVAEVNANGDFVGEFAENVESIVRVLDVNADERLSTLLMSEINIRAMRDEEFAAAWAAQHQEIDAEVEQIIVEVVEAGGLRLRVSSAEAASIINAVWTDVSVRGVIAHLDAERLSELRSAEVGRVARLIIDQT